MTILIYIGITIGSIIGAYIIFMLFMAFAPRKPVPAQPMEKGKKPPPEKHTRLNAQRKDVSFKVKDTSLRAWLYLPEDRSVPVPCIIMGHGLGATKNTGLDSYAIRFWEAGFGVLAFDFRHLGKSDGEPRQLVWIPKQKEDYLAAIEYVRSLQEINPERIALWGTSLSGGHVIVTAAKDQGIV
jgi:cephalosporin-C deacetylase-like acetyl esterase